MLFEAVAPLYDVTPHALMWGAPLGMETTITPSASQGGRVFIVLWLPLTGT